MKMYVFHRANGNHIAIPMEYVGRSLALLVLTVLVGVGVPGVAGPFLGLTVFLGLGGLLAAAFNRDLPMMRAQAQAEYWLKYGDRSPAPGVTREETWPGDYYDREEEELSAGEVDEELILGSHYTEEDVPTLTPIDEDPFVIGYNAGYKAGRKRLDIDTTHMGDEVLDGFIAGYKDGQGHKRRQYYETY